MTTSTQPPDPANPNRLLLIGALCGAAAVLLLVIAILIGYWLGRSSQPSVDAGAATAAAATSTTASTGADPTQLPAVRIEPLPTATVDPALSTPLPTDPALAAEEVDRLSDEQQRLDAQKQTLSQQVTDSNQLIELKAEQIRLLEAELAKTP